jgi:hypothetical protein
MFSGACIIEYTLNIHNVTCKGGNNGLAGITITNGTSPFKYLNSFNILAITILFTRYIWYPINTTSPNAIGLSAGSYIVNITDRSNCTISQTVRVFEPTIGMKL